MKGKLFVFSGAGISAESGIKTFRDSDGTWEEHDVDEVANYSTWKQNFDLVHRFYNDRRAQLATVEPNAAHKMVAQWERDFDLVNITQNVDDLFERAGCKDVTHVHGKLWEMQCTACGHVWDVGYTRWDAGVERCPSPRCECRKGVKPNVVLFNEDAPLYAKLHRTLASLKPEDVVVVVGTSSQVVNIGAMLEHKTAFKVLNNLAPAQRMFDRAIEEVAYDRLLFKPATEAIAEIDALVRERLG